MMFESGRDKEGSLREEGMRKERKARIFEKGRDEGVRKTRIFERGRDEEGAEN